ncbi:MAG: hypothetical protein V2J07_07235 [Anaerolineae bacterium]|nr:hypothetical protein [Anaerolineae bacterium]
MIEEQEDFDILIIGNSHAYCSFVPEIIDHVLVDTNTLNLSSPNLGVAHAAILLRQIIESGNVPEAVVLEVFSVGSDMNDQLQISFFHDYSKTWQLNNLMWMSSYYEPQQLLAPLFPLIHQHENWKQAKLVQENFDNYAERKEKLAAGIAKDLGYLNDGYRGIPVYMTVNEYNIALKEILPFAPREENILGLERILALSEEYGFEVIFVQAPYVTGYQSNYSSLHELFTEYDVPYYLLNETHADQYTRFDYMNPTHLNVHGAIPTTITLAEIMAEEFDRAIDHSTADSFDHLRIEDAIVQREGDQVLVTLVPASPSAKWHVQWEFYLWDEHIVAAENGDSLTFSFPASYLESSVAHLIITITQEGLEYPLTFRLQPKNFE